MANFKRNESVAAQEHEDKVSEIKQVGVSLGSKSITSGGDDKRTMQLTLAERLKPGNLKLLEKVNRNAYFSGCRTSAMHDCLLV